MLTESQIREVFTRFRAANPAPRTELVAPNAFCVLVSVLLSAQATDASVNKATPALFAVADTPAKMGALGVEGIEPYIKSIGLYHAKARHIVGACNALVERFGGEVPDNRDDLMSLPGVGRKTANVVLNVVFRQPTMPVDTHLLRVSPRLGLSEGTTPESVEKDLLAKIPPEFLHDAHHWLLLHGRYICTARNPKCGDCFLSDLCPKNRLEK
jgi:endonuclease-3